MLSQSFTCFFLILLILFHPAVKKKRGEKNHSRQNANEPGSYYNANEIPPQKLLLRYPGYISSIFGKQLYIQNKGQTSSVHSLTLFYLSWSHKQASYLFILMRRPNSRPQQLIFRHHHHLPL